MRWLFRLMIYSYPLYMEEPHLKVLQAKLHRHNDRGKPSRHYQQLHEDSSCADAPVRYSIYHHYTPRIRNLYSADHQLPLGQPLTHCHPSRQRLWHRHQRNIKSNTIDATISTITVPSSVDFMA